MLLVVLDLTFTVLADIDRSLGLALGPADLIKLQRLIFVAARARNPVVALVAVFKARFDPAATGDLRSGDHEHFSPRESTRSGERQVHWVSFTINIPWISIHLVEEQIAGRHRTQAHRAVGASHDQDAAGKFFREHRIAAIARTRVTHQFPQHLALFNQRIDALLRVALGHLDGGLDCEHRAGCLVDDITDPVVSALGAADLRAFHQHDRLDRQMKARGSP